jgi:hypothetical protein
VVDAYGYLAIHIFHFSDNVLIVNEFLAGKKLPHGARF